MTSTIHLVRHATHDRVGAVLCGRMPGVHLSADGRAQARHLAERLSGWGLAAIHTSPIERARETAEPIAERLGLALETYEAITEIQFGEWSGRSFSALQDDSRWRAWNDVRSLSRPPGGESMLEVQARVVRHVEGWCAERGGSAVALVSHGDVIKACLLYYLGLPIDAYQRIEIAPASISTVAIGEWGATVTRLNEVIA